LGGSITVCQRSASGSELHDEVHHRKERAEAKGVIVVMNEDEERAGREHTRSIGLILSQLPAITKRAVRRLLNGSNLVSTAPMFLLISLNLSLLVHRSAQDRGRL
jgi:hypothetical protein